MARAVNPVKRAGKITGLLLLVSLPVVLFLQRWNIYDSWRLRGYQPPFQIVQLASDTTMNDQTRRLFYVYHPELEDKQTFSNDCRSAEKTIVLGCYVLMKGIYLYNVTDARLTGVQQVTAAHETLHAAYDRLSSSDKEHVNKLINEAYAGVTDKRIRANIDEYRKNGADTTNELHSILGTEVRDLPSELEQYYSRYFKDRKAIVAYSERYEGVFTARTRQIAEIDQRLDGLRKQIDAGEAGLQAQEQSIRAERSRLDALAAAKNYDAYNAGVPGFNARVNAYNAEVRRLRGLIDQYNALVVQRNALAAEEGELVKAIDSRPNNLQTQ